MVEIPEEERKNFPNGQGGFYDKKIDTDNSIFYDSFIDGMSKINDILKQNAQGGEQNWKIQDTEDFTLKQQTENQ